MIDTLIPKTRCSLGVYVLSTILLLGPACLLAVPFTSGNTGLLPYLISPFLLAIFLPYLCTEGDRVLAIFLEGIWYSLYIGFVFGAAYMLFDSPRPGAILKGLVVLNGLAFLIAGLYILVLGMFADSFLAQWCATIVGLLITGSFIYLSPVADALYAERALRNVVIGSATSLNPVLAMSGGILQQDLLRGAFLYEHLSIGRYYAYSAPSWQRVGLIYLVFGGLMATIGRWLRDHRPLQGDEVCDPGKQVNQDGDGERNI